MLKQIFTKGWSKVLNGFLKIDKYCLEELLATYKTIDNERIGGVMYVKFYKKSNGT